MQVHIGKIKGKRGASLEFSLRQELPSPWEMEEARLEGPVDFSGHVTNTGKGYLVEGVLRAEATFACDRCLEPFRTEIRARVQEQFRTQKSAVDRREDEEPVEDREEPDEPEEWNVFQGETLALDEVVRDHLVLALPVKLLCRPDCQGICPRCGRNRNLVDCGCPADDIDPRLASLMDLLKNDQ